MPKQTTSSARFYQIARVICLFFLCFMSSVHAQSSSDCTEPAELVFTLWGSPFEKQAILDATDAFNESHPCIHVRAQHIPNGSYAEKITTMLAAGEPPDVAYLGENQAFPWAQEGKILDLTKYFAAEPADQSLLASTYYHFDDGKKLMGTGLATGIILLYYNKDIFEAAGVDAPPSKAEDAWTWDEFVQVAKKLTKDRNGNDATSPDFDPGNIDTYGIAFPQWWGGYLPFILSNGGKIVNDEGTEMMLNQPEAVEALQKMQDLIYVDHVAPTPAQSQTLPSADVMMQSRKVAMSIDGMWKVVDFSNLGLNWGMAVLPKLKEPQTFVLSTPKVIFSSTKHPDEAFEFYKYISDPAQVALFKEGLWSPLEKRYFTDPAKTADWLEGDPGVYPPEAKSVLVDYTLNDASYQPPAYWLKNAGQIFSEAIDPAMDLLWTGKVTAQEAADQAVKNATPLLQGRW